MPTLQQMQNDLAAQYKAYIAFLDEDEALPDGERREKGEKMFKDIETLKAKVEETTIQERRQNEAKHFLEEQRKPAKLPPFQNLDQSSNGREAEKAWLESIKPVSQLVVESETYKMFQGKHTDASHYTITIPRSYKAATNPNPPPPGTPEAQIATGVITNTTGYQPFIPRTPRIVFQQFQPPTIRDLMPSTPISTQGIQYMTEATFTNAAAAVAEGAVKPQSMLQYTPVNIFAEVIATYLVVTNQQLDDAPIMRNLIDNRGRLMIDLKEDFYLLNGTGVSPQIQGFLTVTGLLTQSKGTAMLQDAILQAIYKVWTTSFVYPSGIVMNPSDWATLRATTATGSGIYLFGPPTEQGIQTLWGLPVVLSTQIAAGSPLVGAFSTQAEILQRQETIVAVGLVNDDFIRNQQTIRIEERLANAIYRPAAFCKLVP